MKIDHRLLAEKYQGILNELSPVYSGDYDPSTAAQKITAHKPMLGGKPIPSGYEIGKTAERTNQNVVDLTKEVLDKIKVKLFQRQASSVAGKQYDLFYPGEPDTFKQEVAQIIADVCKLPKVTTGCDHAARIVMNNVLDVVAVRTGGAVKASSTKIKQASVKADVQQAVQQAVEEKPTAPAEVLKDLYPRPKKFKLIGTYRVAEDFSDTACNSITDPERRANAKIARTRLINAVGKGLSERGSEIVRKIKMPYSSAVQALSDLLNVGGISDTAEETESQSAAMLEAEPEDEKDVVAREVDDLTRAVMGGKTDVRGSNE